MWDFSNAPILYGTKESMFDTDKKNLVMHKYMQLKVTDCNDK